MNTNETMNLMGKDKSFFKDSVCVCAVLWSSKEDILGAEDRPESNPLCETGLMSHYG